MKINFTIYKKFDLKITISINEIYFAASDKKRINKNFKDLISWKTVFILKKFIDKL